MRTTLMVLVLAVARTAFAEDAELFVDRGETFIRAGSDQGLQRGVAIDVLAGKGGKKVGSATVMEVWPSLARVNLDEGARTDKTPVKYATLGAAKAQPPVAPTPPPPPPANANNRKPLGDPPPPPPPARGELKGRAVYGGAGPWTALQVIN